MSKSPAEPPYNPLELWFPGEALPGAARRKTDSRRVSSPATKKLTPSRPRLSYPEPLMADSRGLSAMDNTTTAPRGELVILNTARDTRREFLLLDRALSALAPRGSKKCRKTVGRMARAFRSTLLPTSNSGSVDDDLVMLGARCALCPRRCKTPVRVD
jgi:hypothetical protein